MTIALGQIFATLLVHLPHGGAFPTPALTSSVAPPAVERAPQDSCAPPEVAYAMTPAVSRARGVSPNQVTKIATRTGTVATSGANPSPVAQMNNAAVPGSVSAPPNARVEIAETTAVAARAVPAGSMRSAALASACAFRSVTNWNVAMMVAERPVLPAACHTRPVTPAVSAFASLIAPIVNVVAMDVTGSAAHALMANTAQTRESASPTAIARLGRAAMAATTCHPTTCARQILQVVSGVTVVVLMWVVELGRIAVQVRVLIVEVGSFWRTVGRRSSCVTILPGAARSFSGLTAAVNAHPNANLVRVAIRTTISSQLMFVARTTPRRTTAAHGGRVAAMMLVYDIATGTVRGRAPRATALTAPGRLGVSPTHVSIRRSVLTMTLHATLVEHVPTSGVTHAQLDAPTIGCVLRGHPTRATTGALRSAK